MKRLLLALAILVGVSLIGSDAFARGRVRVRIGHRHRIHRHHQPVYRTQVYRSRHVYRPGYVVPHRYYGGGYGGVYIGSPGVSIGIRF